MIEEGEQPRVYVVTTDPSAEYAWIHDRLPLLAALQGEAEDQR